MVAVGLTETGVPLVTGRLPGVIMPVPFAKTAVRLELFPLAIVLGLAPKLVIVGAGSTVTVVVWLTSVPAPLVTVSMYWVVAVGLTGTDVPLVTEMLPGVTTPVPFANTAVRLVLFPLVIVAEVAVKLVIVGAGSTVTVAWEVTAVPAALVTASVYCVVAVGLTETGVPLVTEMLPGVMTPVPPANTAVRLELFPLVIVTGLAAKLVIVGPATAWTDTVWLAVPPEPVTVSV